MVDGLVEHDDLRGLAAVEVIRLYAALRRHEAGKLVDLRARAAVGMVDGHEQVMLVPGHADAGAGVFKVHLADGVAAALLHDAVVYQHGAEGEGKDGSVKVLDFGTARMQSVYGEKSLSVMLKPGFAPEEQYRTHGEQGPWTDVYAMSATIYRLITGKTPPSSTDRVFEDTLELPSKLGVKITPLQEQALMRGLAVRAADRIQTMEELAKCLSGERKVKKLRRRLAWKKPAAAVLALAVLGGGVYALLNSNADTAAGTAASGTKPSTATADNETERAGKYVLEDKYLCVKEIWTDSDGNVSRISEEDYDDYGYRIYNKNTWYNQYGEEGSFYEDKFEYAHYDDTGADELTYSADRSEDEDLDESYWEYEYDGNGEAIKRFEFDAEHDLKGWQEFETIEGVEYTYSYYPDGGLENYTKRWYDEGTNMDYYESYDAYGNLTGRSENKYEYDEAAQTSTQTYRYFYDGVLSSEEIYVYDADDRLIDGKYTSYNNYSGGEPIVYTITEEYELRQVYCWHYLDEE